MLAQCINYKFLNYLRLAVSVLTHARSYLKTISTTASISVVSAAARSLQPDLPQCSHCIIVSPPRIITRLLIITPRLRGKYLSFVNRSHQRGDVYF